MGILYSHALCLLFLHISLALVPLTCRGTHERFTGHSSERVFQTIAPITYDIRSRVGDSSYGVVYV